MLSGICRISLITRPALVTLSFSFFWAQTGKTVSEIPIISHRLIMFPQYDNARLGRRTRLSHGSLRIGRIDTFQ